MARRSRSIDWERWQRQQAREAARQQSVAAAAAKAAERAEREQRIADRRKEAAQRTSDLERRVEQLSSLLAMGHQHNSGIDFGALKRTPRSWRFDPGDLAGARPRPTLGQFQPQPPGALRVLFGGLQRHEQRVA